MTKIICDSFTREQMHLFPFVRRLFCLARKRKTVEKKECHTNIYEFDSKFRDIIMNLTLKRIEALMPAYYMNERIAITMN